MSDGYFFNDLSPEEEAQQRTLALAAALRNRPNATGAYGGLANAGRDIASALMAKKANANLTNLGEDRSQNYARALGNALGPSDNSTWDVGPETNASGDPGQLQISPRVGAPLAQRLAATMNPDLMKQAAPTLLAQQMPPPITPYQQAELKDRADQRNYERNTADYATLDKGSDVIQQAMDQSVSIPKSEAAISQAGAKSAAEAAAKFPYEKQLADTRAASQAALTGQFGRSMEGHSYNILAAGLKDPSARSSAEYWTAWQILSNPKLDPATGTIVTPDLSAFAPPEGKPPPGLPPQSGAAPTDPTSPPGAPPQRMPNVTSFAPPNPSQPEAASAGFANRLQSSGDAIDQNQSAGLSLYNRAIGGTKLGNYVVPKEYQMLDQAERNFVNAQLRRESGAVISEEEFANAKKQYFPQPGDSKEVLAQKKASRDMAVRNMQLSAGNTLLGPGQLQQAGPPRGVTPIPQTQGFGGPNGLQAPPAASAPTATGPNGQKLTLQNGQWVPVK